MKMQLVRATTIAFALMLSFFVSECLADDKAQVLAIEAELKAIDHPVQKTNKRISSLLEKTCPEGSSQKCYTLYRKTMVSAFEKAQDVSVAADNKCYALNQKLHNTNVSRAVKTKLIDIVCAMSLKYMETTNSYGLSEEAFEQLLNKNMKEYGRLLEESNKHMQIVKQYHAAALTTLYDLKTSLGIPVAQK